MNRSDRILELAINNTTNNNPSTSTNDFCYRNIFDTYEDEISVHNLESREENQNETLVIQNTDGNIQMQTSISTTDNDDFRNNKLLSGVDCSMSDIEDGLEDDDKDPNYNPNENDELSDSDCSMTITKKARINTTDNDDCRNNKLLSGVDCSMSDIEDGLDDDDKDPNYNPNENDELSDSDCSMTITKKELTMGCNEDVPNLEMNNSADVHINPVCKRKRNKFPKPEIWKQNVLRKKVQSGEEHTTKSGNVVNQKSVKPCDCTKCHRKCNLNFDEDLRRNIHSEYWALRDYNMQRQYLNGLICEKDKVVKRTSSDVSRRNKSREFYLYKNGQQMQVCQKIFLCTFGISDSVIKTILKKRSDCNVLPSDRRGKQSPGVKKSEDIRNSIIEHINSFPRVPSHYCRKDSKKEYLTSDLNVSKMFEMYLEKCKDNNIMPEKESFYRNILATEFNIGFHVPRKDQCDKCYAFERLTKTDQDKNIDQHKKHLERKNQARSLRDSFKEKSKKGECHFVQFDLEAVRYCPAYLVTKKFYYKRRLAVYNLTVYNLATSNAENFMWHEGVGGRGSNEIASCIFQYLRQYNTGNVEWTFMSDTCGGQNRNVNVVAMFVYAIKTLEDIPVINHIFFEPGHSQMECDTVHAHIQSSTAKIEIYDPSAWYTAVRCAVKGKKYSVKEIDQNEIYDFKKIAKQLITNKNVDTDGNVVRWLDISWLQFRKISPDEVYFKYCQEDNFKSFKLTRRGRRSSAGVPSLVLPLAYSGPLCIQQEKLNDLIGMCSDGTIKQQYHSFYQNLKGTSTRSDIEEDED